MGHGSVVNRFSWQTLLTADSLSITPLEWQVPCLGNTLKKLYQQQKAGAVLLWGWFFFFSLSFACPLKDYFYYFIASLAHAPTLDVKSQLLTAISPITLFAAI